MTPIESFKIDHGTDPYGNRRIVHVESDRVVHQTTFDAEPFLEAAKEERALTDGKRWGEGVGTKVGTIPMAVYAQALMMDTESRQKYLLNWLRENPAFCTFNKFLK